MQSISGTGESADCAASVSGRKADQVRQIDKEKGSVSDRQRQFQRGWIRPRVQPYRSPRHCKHVGVVSALTTRLCPSCGAPNDRSVDFCPNCGTYLQWSGTESWGTTTGSPNSAAVAGSRPRSAPKPVRTASPQPSNETRMPVVRKPSPPAVAPLDPAGRQPPSTPPAVRRIPTVVHELGPRSGLVPRVPFADSDKRSRFRGPPQQSAAARLGPAPQALEQEDIPGGVRCRRCRRSNPPGRRYCRCGASLMPFESSTAAGSRRQHQASTQGRRSFQSAMRSSAGGRRPRFDIPVAGRVRALRAVAVILAIGLLILPFTGPAAAARSWLGNAAQALIPYSYQPVEVVNATVEPAEAAVDNYQPTNAVDGSSSLAWAVAWSDPETPAQCGTASSPALVVQFARPTDVSRIVIYAGLDPSDTNQNRQIVPKVVDILFSTGTCDRVELTPDNGAQEFKVDGAQADDARMQIVAVYPPQQTTNATDQNRDGRLAAISEIRVYHA